MGKKTYRFLKGLIPSYYQGRNYALQSKDSHHRKSSINSLGGGLFFSSTFEGGLKREGGGLI